LLDLLNIELAAIKAREVFPNEELYYIKLSDNEFILRAITPSEYISIKEISNTTYDEEDLILQTCIVYPSNYNVLQGDAGLPKILADQILKFSLLHKDSKQDIHDRFKYYTYKVENDIEAQIPLIIKIAFPEYTFEQIDSWAMDLQLKNLAKAMAVLEAKVSIANGVHPVAGFDLDSSNDIIPTWKDKEKEMEEQGYDSVFALYKEYKTIPELIDKPFIIGRKWNEVNYAIKKR